MNRPIHIDTNVFVTAFETEGEPSERAWTILDAVTRGEVRAQTSELTLAELLPKPLQLGSKLVVEIYKGLVATGGALAGAPVGRSILIKAGEIRALDRRTRLPDAIHVATALETDCAAFVSDDRRLRPPTSIPLVHLGPDCLKIIQGLIV